MQTLGGGSGGGERSAVRAAVDVVHDLEAVGAERGEIAALVARDECGACAGEGVKSAAAGHYAGDHARRDHRRVEACYGETKRDPGGGAAGAERNDYAGRRGQFAACDLARQLQRGVHVSQHPRRAAPARRYPVHVAASREE